MDISKINFSKIIFPLEKKLLEVSNGDIEEFEKLIDVVGKMTFRDDFSFCDVDRLIVANKGYKKQLKRSALNDNFIDIVLPLIKQYENCKDIENKPIYLQGLICELHNSYWENINEEDLICRSYSGEMLDSLLPMREMSVRVKFNEELESLREYIVEKMKSRQTADPTVGEGR